MFLISHKISRRRCVFVLRLLPDWSVLARFFRLVRRCRKLSAFRFLPVILNRLHHHHHRHHRQLRCHYLPAFYSGRLLVFRLEYPGDFGTTGRISHPVRVSSADFPD